MVLDKYISTTVTKGALLAMFVLGALFAFIDFVGELKEVGRGNYGVIQAVYYVVLSLPQRLYELAPSVILLGGLVSLGALAANSELVVMRASGITAMRIVASVLYAGIMLAVIVAVAGEYIAPNATSKAKSMRAAALDQRMFSGGINGFWARDGNRYVNVRRVLPDLKLDDVSVFILDDNRRLSSSVHARNAYYQGDRWILTSVKRSVITDQGVETTTSKREQWPELVKPELFTVLSLEPDDMSATDLYHYIGYLKDNELDSASFRLAFWIKLFTPLTCVVMLLVAMPFVFDTTPRSGGTGQRVIIGVVLGVVFYVLNRAVNHLGIVYSIEPAVSAALPLLIVTSVVVYYLRRLH